MLEEESRKLQFFCRELKKDITLLQKYDVDDYLTDVNGEHQTSWALLPEKGYQGVQNNVREILSMKKRLLLT